MRTVVVGAGAIGTLYAAMLSPRTEVTLLTRTGPAAAATIQLSGLEDALAELRIAPTLDAVGPDTSILVTTKAYDAADAVRGLVHLLRPDTVVVCLHNGLRVEDEVTEVVGGRCAVLRAITYFGAILERPLVVSLRARGQTSIEAGPASAGIAALWSACGLDCRVSASIQHEVWQKTVANAVINPLTAMTGMEVGWVADERLDPLKRTIVEECVAVARCDGVALDTDLTASLNDTFRPSSNLSSMYQDLIKGRRTEIDYLNGAVVALGQRYGIACPTNAALATIVRQLERRALAPRA